MADFQLKSFSQIVSSMAAKMATETPITDFNPGSVVLTLLEAAAQEDYQQYVQMLHILRAFYLDTIEGEDLDKKAKEYNLTRLAPLPHSGYVTISDVRFNKISSKIYAGLAGPTAGAFTLNIDDASLFTSTGELYIGRGTVNSEGPIAYSASPVDNSAYWTITLDTALVNDHGTDETVILAQEGTRVIEAGTEVAIPETDYNEQILFELNQTVELLDGEDTLENVLVTALEPGGYTVSAGAIAEFTNPPFPGAAVTNPLPFTNGRDEESDQSLRDRIRETIQSLSRGTTQSVRTGIIGLVDEDTNSSIVSAKVVTPVTLADGPSQVFIDNGRGLEPDLTTVGLETVISSAKGGEQFLQLKEFPLVKASVISQNVEPFNLSGNETLIIKVGINEETFTFSSDDFSVVGRAEATEISEAINNRASLVEARTITDSDGKRIILTPRVSENEDLQIDSASTAQTALNFPTIKVRTLKLYKNDQLLTKDGSTASLLSEEQPFNLNTEIVTTTDGDFTVTGDSRIVSKSVAGSFPFRQYIHTGDYIKLSSDPDDYYSRVRTVVSDTKLILESSYNNLGGGVGDIVIWNSPQLEVAANGDKEETEVVSFSPNDFINPAQATSNEVYTRMIQEINLSNVSLSVNNSRLKIVSNLENSANSKIQVLGGAAAIAMGYSSTVSLTGTISFTGGNVIVVGSGTSFLSELEEGQWIKADSHGNGSWTKIETIESNTILYLTEGYRGATVSGAAASKIEFSELAEGKNKDYVLNRTNGQIELTTPLVAGDNVTAGSVDTRAFVDSVLETFDFDSIGATSTLIVAVDKGFEASVTTGDGSAPYNTFRASSLIGYEPNFFVGFQIEWVGGNNNGEVDFVASYDNTTGEIVSVNNFSGSINIGDQFVLNQVITFTNATDFVDAQNVTAAEVVAAINSQILGGKSEELSTGAVRLRTSNFGDLGAIQVKGGSANNVLGFELTENLNQVTNLAYVISGNSDRSGLDDFLGYTLGPDQNLVVILDDDSANKTFGVKLQVSDTVDTGGTGTFTASSDIPSKYTIDDYFKDFWVYWTSGSNEGSVQTVDSYNATTGVFTVTDVFPASVGAISAGDEYVLVPRTAENVSALINNYNVTTFSIEGTSEVIEITGDYVQLSTKTSGSVGKVYVTGGSANSLGISITGTPVGAPVNDVTVNSKAGLAKGLFVKLSVDAEVTTADTTVPYNTFRSSDLISSLPNYFQNHEIEFLTGFNAGSKTTITSYDNTTGEIILADNMTNAINLEDTFRVSQPAVVVDIQGSASPYTISFNDLSNSAIDVSGYTTALSSAIRDYNGLNFDTIQVEGVDGYKHYSGLIQLAQWTIDGLDRDSLNYPGIGAGGTQFEVLTSVIVKLKITLNVTPEEGKSLSSISGDVSNAVSEYINSRGVGDDVVLTEIIASVQNVIGVYDVEIVNHDENIIIADNELARIDVNDIVIG